MVQLHGSKLAPMHTLGHIAKFIQLLATTRSIEHLKFRELPPSQNAIVAILCYIGYNQQEDSVIMNQSSVDHGLFRGIYYRSYMDLEKMSGTQQSEEKPMRENTLRLKQGTYDNDPAAGSKRAPTCTHLDTSRNSLKFVFYTILGICASIIPFPDHRQVTSY